MVSYYIIMVILIHLMVNNTIDYNITDNMKYEWRSGSCKQCSGWMYDINHETLRYTPEKDYPVQLFTENIINNKLKPIIITKSNIEKQINNLISLLKEKK